MKDQHWLNWKITFTCPDYLEKSVNLFASTAELLEATRNEHFSMIIADSPVEGALVAYGEAVVESTDD